MEYTQAIALDLAKQWETRASRKFEDATSEKDPMGKRLIEHGATCYFNAAAEIRRAYGLPDLVPNLIEVQRHHVS